jgi:hypothetical protein
MARVDVQRTDPGNKPHELAYGGSVFTLPPTLPVAALEAMLGEGKGEQLLMFFQAVLGDQWDAFAEVLNPADLPALGEAIGEIYGSSLGESQASGTSSSDDSES